MTIQQIKVGYDNFSYLIYDPKTKDAALVDPSYDIQKANKIIRKQNLHLQYIILTHYHLDHTKETPKIKTIYPKARIVASKADGQHLNLHVDKIVTDKDHLRLGEIILRIILTPGHTPGGICIKVNDIALVTGDTLFIGDCGRTDLSGGNLHDMFQSLQGKIKTLADHLIVYPGHDYGEKPFDTLENQKHTNKTLLAKNIKEFSRIS